MIYLLNYVSYLVFHWKGIPFFSWVSRLLIIVFSDTLAKLYLCGDALQVYFHTIPDEIIEKLVILKLVVASA